MCLSNLTKQEIMDQARKEGIKISYEMLGKYVRYGLLKGRKNERGGRKVVYMDALANIRMVRKYNTEPYFFTLEDTLFLLYWHGQPIRTEILLDRLREYQTELKMTFQEAVKDVQNPELLENYYKGPVRKQLVPSYSKGQDGRLHKDTEKQLEEATKSVAAAQAKFRKFIADIETYGGITLTALTPILENPEQLQQDFQTFLESHSAFRIETWMDNSLFTNPENELLLNDLIRLFQEYWSVLISSPITQTEIFQSVSILLDILLLQITPKRCQSLLFWILASGMTTGIVNWLDQPEIKAVWHKLWYTTDWANFKPFLKGGDFHA